MPLNSPSDFPGVLSAEVEDVRARREALFPRQKPLEAAPAPPGGYSPLCIHLREKQLPDGELLRRARIVAQKCRQARALFIVNDRADVALLAGADGVHVGQSDLPCAGVRRILGSNAIVGVSTENLAQARHV